MAETRAKARALRDFTGITMCSMEELGGDDKKELTDEEKAIIEKKKEAKLKLEQQKKDAQKKLELEKQEKATTQAQLKKMFTCLTKLGLNEQNSREYLKLHYNVKETSKELTKEQVSEIIKDTETKELKFDETGIAYFIVKEV